MTGETAGTSSQASQGVPGWTWPDYIGWGWMIVQARMEADWTGLWDYAMPNPKASEETVARAEARLGFRLPESYRGFLLAADGWPCFFQDMTIFSTSDLLGGELHKAGQIQLELEECVEAMAAGGVIAADHFTVVASRESIEIALMGKPGTPAEGTVSWVRVADHVVHHAHDHRGHRQPARDRARHLSGHAQVGGGAGLQGLEGRHCQ